MLKNFELGQEALSYIREQLKEGIGLSECLLKYVALEDGNVSTTLPELTAEQAALNFSVGGVAKRGETEPLLVERIGKYLQNPGHAAIFEDRLARKGDLCLRSSRADFVTRGNEVYYILVGPLSTTEKIARTVRFSSSYNLLGVLATLDLPLINNLHSGAEISLSTLEAFAKKTAYLLVGAYDGEGELVWAHK